MKTDKSTSEKWMPLSQKIRQQGIDMLKKYPLVTTSQIRTWLREDDLMYNYAMDIFTSLSHKGKKDSKLICTFVWEHSSKVVFTDTSKGQTSLVESELHKKDIDYYDGQINEDVINEVNNAMALGFKKFDVWWLEINLEMQDRIVVTTNYDNKCLLLARP
ncbi:MAG: hypothetical protein ACLFQA_00425 [Bacteroidales bacterium]